jgi:hypothetical protein
MKPLLIRNPKSAVRNRKAPGENFTGGFINRNQYASYDLVA